MGESLADIAAENAFDLVLLDVPCSATGVMRRNPDVKVIRLKSDINQFAELQQALLESAWKRVRPSGSSIHTAHCCRLKTRTSLATLLSVNADAKTIPLSESFGIAKGVGGDRPCHQPVAATAFTTACSKKIAWIWSSREIGVPFASNELDHPLFKEPRAS